MFNATHSFNETTNAAIDRIPSTRDARLLLQRAGFTLAMAAVWGFAAGSARPTLALLDVYKVPMVLSLSLLVALPAVLVARHLLDITLSTVALLIVIVSALELGALVLIAFAPLIAVYAYTSQWVAPVLAQWSAGLALLVGLVSLFNGLMKVRAPKGALVVLSAVTAVAFCLAIVQLISLATPILPVHTAFGAGIDGMLHR